jgi:hypothetical protein
MDTAAADPPSCVRAAGSGGHRWWLVLEPIFHVRHVCWSTIWTSRGEEMQPFDDSPQKNSKASFACLLYRTDWQGQSQDLDKEGADHRGSRNNIWYHRQILMLA